MSGDGGDGGDIGGGGDGGGGGKGGGGDKGGGGGGPDVMAPADTADYSSSSPTAFAPTDTGPSVSDFVSNPTGSPTDVVNDPSQGNLTGPGPVTGSPASGGTGSPFAFDNSSFLSAADSMAQPVSTGVFDTGASAVPNLTSSSVPGQAGFQSVMDSTAAAPAGPSAMSFAAPSAVAASPDATSSTDLSNLVKSPSSGSGGGGTSQASTVSDSLGIKPNAGAIISGIGLGNALINGRQSPPYSPQLNQTAAAASATADQQTSAGQALQQWQTTGTLPASYESQVQRAAQDAKTRAISNAAAQGLPTDPTKNTALAQQLNAIDAAIPGQREAIATQLAQSGQQMINAGLQATGITSGVYQNLATLQNQKDQATGQAIANFATALNGGNKGVTLQLAK